MIFNQYFSHNVKIKKTIIDRKMENLDLKTNISVTLKKNVIDAFSTRFGNIENDSRLATATLLDPRYKKLHFTDEVALRNAVKSVRTVIEDQFATSQDSDKENSLAIPQEKGKDEDFWAFHEELISSTKKNDKRASTIELDLYLEEPPISHDENAIAYWKNRPETTLSKLALKYLNMTATSVPSERVFSKTGQIITKKRNRLKPKNVQNILFLNSLSNSYWQWL